MVKAPDANEKGPKVHERPKIGAEKVRKLAEYGAVKSDPMSAMVQVKTDLQRSA